MILNERQLFAQKILQTFSEFAESFQNSDFNEEISNFPTSPWTSVNVGATI